VGCREKGGCKTSVEKDYWSPHYESSRPEAHIGDDEEKVGGEA
jgi:hypothetical protein